MDHKEMVSYKDMQNNHVVRYAGHKSWIVRTNVTVIPLLTFHREQMPRYYSFCRLITIMFNISEICLGFSFIEIMFIIQAFHLLTCEIYILFIIRYMTMGFHLTSTLIQC